MNTTRMLQWSEYLPNCTPQSLSLPTIPWNCPKGTGPQGWLLSDDLLHESLNQVGREILCHGFHEFSRILKANPCKSAEIRG